MSTARYGRDRAGIAADGHPLSLAQRGARGRQGDWACRKMSPPRLANTTMGQLRE